MRTLVEQQVLASLLAYLYPAPIRTTGAIVPCRSCKKAVWLPIVLQAMVGFGRVGREPGLCRNII